MSYPVLGRLMVGCAAILAAMMVPLEARADDMATGPGQTLASTERLSDFDCAASYWLLSAVNASDRQGALQRAQFAGGRYLEANPAEDTASAQQKVIAEAHKRGEAISTLRASFAEVMGEMAESQGVSEDRLGAINRRYESIQRDLMHAEQDLLSDVAACEAKYGFAQTKGQ